MRYGRPAAARGPVHGPSESSVPTGSSVPNRREKAADRVFALGCALAAGLLVWMSASGIQERIQSPGTPDTSSLPPDAVPVMSSAFSGEEREELAWGEETDRSAAVEPFGYLDGEWNVWEYLGDLFSSLLLP